MDLCRRIGILPPSLSRIESGRVNPTIRTLADLADGLGVHVFELFDDPGTTPEVSEIIRRLRALPPDQLAAILVMLQGIGPAR